MGEAKSLNLLNTTTWHVSNCLRLHPFFLHLGDRALAPCVLAPCVYMQRQRQETSRQAMEKRDVQIMQYGYKVDKHTSKASITCGRRHDKQQDKQAKYKANKKGSNQTRKKANKRWCLWGDKCRFGSDVQDFIVLKYGRHTSKQDSCMNMQESV